MSNGGVCGYHAMGWLDLIQSVRPSIFLNSNVKIISGDGTRENSYKLELIGE